MVPFNDTSCNSISCYILSFHLMLQFCAAISCMLPCHVILRSSRVVVLASFGTCHAGPAVSNKSWRLTSCLRTQSLHSSPWHHVPAILHNGVVLSFSGRSITPASLRMLVLISESYSDHACSLLDGAMFRPAQANPHVRTLQSISSSAMCWPTCKT